MDPDTTLALARALIERPSVTPEDAGCQTLLMGRLTALGFQCTSLPFDDTENFWAEWGHGGPLLVFAGHTDVVPPGPRDAWHSDPFRPEERDGLLFGRGAADMKGSLAAMITACERFLAREQHGKGRIGFLITSDEEGPARNGTVRVMQWLDERDIRIDYCIVGEPSSVDALGDTIKNGRRGSLNASVRIRGRQGHVAYPQLALNPIHQALPALVELTGRRWDEGNEYFPPTSLQISNISAGTGASNVIPGELELLMNFRFSTQQSSAGLRSAVEECFDRHGIDATIHWDLSGEPFLTPEGALVRASREAIREVAGIDTVLSTSGGTSDGRFIAPYGVEVVELGPVNASIHRVNEHVIVDDLERLARMYEGILERLLGRQASL
ncbi:MAG: succinyl-diaminopimelate desuccinylase [Halieaceae bacterium]|jgi:succinyl-diaminopimelate desuccinylase|nr:succinyl-diaminopimelate desuccinylase [Halieaceae bacterium]